MADIASCVCVGGVKEMFIVYPLRHQTLMLQYYLVKGL